MINHIEDLDLKLKEILQKVDSNKKYYHYRTINNFIFFMKEIKLTNEREKIYFSLNKYLEVVNENPLEDASDSLQIFHNHIRPIGKLYEDFFGFVPMINLSTIAFWYGILALLLYVINAGFLFYIITATPLAAYYSFISFKRINKKVYGYMY